MSIHEFYQKVLPRKWGSWVFFFVYYKPPTSPSAKKSSQAHTILMTYSGLQISTAPNVDVVPCNLAAWTHKCMSIGSISGLGTGLTARNMRISPNGAAVDNSELRNRLSSPAATTPPQDDTDTAKVSKASNTASSKTSNGSTSASSEEPDYSSMAKVDLMKLALMGDREAKKELEKRESSSESQNGTGVGTHLDVVA